MPKCPICEYPDAEVLYLTVKCRNERCINYNQEYDSERFTVGLDKFLDDFFGKTFSEPPKEVSKDSLSDPDKTPQMWLFPDPED